MLQLRVVTHPVSASELGCNLDQTLIITPDQVSAKFGSYEESRQRKKFQVAVCVENYRSLGQGYKIQERGLRNRHESVS